MGVFLVTVFIIAIIAIGYWMFKKDNFYYGGDDDNCDFDIEE